MLHLRAIPIILYFLGGGLFCLLLWVFLQAQNQRGSPLWVIENRSDPLVWLLVLATFTMGIFLAYVLLV